MMAIKSGTFSEIKNKCIELCPFPPCSKKKPHSGEKNLPDPFMLGLTFMGLAPSSSEFLNSMHTVIFRA